MDIRSLPINHCYVGIVDYPEDYPSLESSQLVCISGRVRHSYQKDNSEREDCHTCLFASPTKGRLVASRCMCVYGRYMVCHHAFVLLELLQTACFYDKSSVVMCFLNAIANQLATPAWLEQNMGWLNTLLAHEHPQTPFADRLEMLKPGTERMKIFIPVTEDSDNQPAGTLEFFNPRSKRKRLLKAKAQPSSPSVKSSLMKPAWDSFNPFCNVPGACTV